MANEQLSQALSSLVDGAVQRLIAAGVGDGLALAEELRLAQQENEELRAALLVDDVELSRLYGVLVELERKCAHLKRLQKQTEGEPQQQQHDQQQQTQQAAVAAEAATATAAAATVAAAPSHEQQLEWRLARLKQQADAAKSKLAEREAELAAAQKQASQREAQLGARLQQAQAERSRLEQRLQRQAEDLAAAQQEAALLRARQAAADKPLPTKAKTPAAAAPLAAPAEPAGADGAAAAEVPQQLTAMLQHLRQELVTSLRSELQLQLGPLSAALAQQSQPPLPGTSLSPSVGQLCQAPLPLLSPVLLGVGSAEAVPSLALPQHAGALPGSQGKPPSPPSTAVQMEMSEDEEGQPPLPLALLPPLAQQGTAATPCMPGLLQPAAQHAPPTAFSPAVPRAVQPQMRTPFQQQPPTTIPPQQATLPLLPQQAARLPSPAGSPTPAVTAAIAAAQSLASKLAAEQLALRTREEEQKRAAAQAAAAAAAATAGAVPAGSVAAQQGRPPSRGSLQQASAMGAGARQQAAGTSTAAAAATAASLAKPVQQQAQQQAGTGTPAGKVAAVEELPPWLALAASIRAKQLEAAAARPAKAAAATPQAAPAAAAGRPQAAAQAAPAVAAAPGGSTRRDAQLQHWRQIALAHADSRDGLPPKTLPFSVPEGSDPERIVKRAAAGELPYCCPPCRQVFGSETEYLEHQLDKAHFATCRNMFHAYTGNTLSDPRMQIVRAKGGGRPAVQLDQAQRKQAFCCLACSRILKLEQFIHHVCCLGHVKAVQAALKAAKQPAKRQKV
ncbi:hypothetical protein ABPG75_013762 [Micractinium tetrahymenae]